MFTRADFGNAMKEKIRQRIDFEEIGFWAHEMYMQNINDIMENDPDLRSILIRLTMMELGPDFSFSYERLEEIANDLIAGKKDVNMDY